MTINTDAWKAYKGITAPIFKSIRAAVSEEVTLDLFQSVNTMTTLITFNAIVANGKIVQLVLSNLNIHDL